MRPAPIPDETLRYTRSPASRPAPKAASASAPRFASLSTMTGMSSRFWSSDAAVMPIQPGRIAEEPTVPWPWSIGPGRPMPAPITASLPTPASWSVSTTNSAAISRPSWASWSVSSGRVRSARIVDARSDTATRRCEWPKSTPTAAPALASKDSRIGGRPPCAPYAHPGSGRSMTRLSACRSATRLETVERLSPVRRAMSAREISPSLRSAWMTRRRLRRRSDSSEPARPGGMKAVPLEREKDGPSTYSTDRPWDARLDRLSIGVGGDDHAAGELVLPTLLLLVPEHPEIAEEEDDRGQVLVDLAHEAAAITDRAAFAEVVHPDPERALADLLAGRATLEVRVVAQRHDRLEEEVHAGAVPEDDPQDDRRDQQDQTVEQCRAEALPEAGSRAARTARVRAGRGLRRGLPFGGHEGLLLSLGWASIGLVPVFSVFSHPPPRLRGRQVLEEGLVGEAVL